VGKFILFCSGNIQIKQSLQVVPVIGGNTIQEARVLMLLLQLMRCSQIIHLQPGRTLKRPKDNIEKLNGLGMA